MSFLGCLLSLQDNSVAAEKSFGSLAIKTNFDIQGVIVDKSGNPN